VIGTVDQAGPLIDTVLDRAMAALCAEAVGIMDALHATTVEYLKTRQQFGQPIGRFQALQHRAVDMLVQLEQARSMALLAASKVDSPDVSERRRTVAAAKEMAGRAGRFVGQQAIQLHGGMGMTDELNVSHFFKRLTAIDVLFGNSTSQRTRFATMKEIQPAAQFTVSAQSEAHISSALTVSNALSHVFPSPVASTTRPAALPLARVAASASSASICTVFGSGTAGGGSISTPVTRGAGGIRRLL